jgi:hypothetical protein
MIFLLFKCDFLLFRFADWFADWFAFLGKNGWEMIFLSSQKKKMITAYL